MNKKLHINVSKPSHEQLNTLLEFYQTGRYIDAEKLSLSITKEFPKHLFAWNVLGAVLKRNGKKNESLAVCQKFVQLNPHEAGAHYNLGIILKELGRLEEAEASYRQTILLKPDFAEAYNNLGNSLKELGRLKEAEASYKKAITLKPDYAEAYNNLSVTLQELGRLNDAEASYRQAIVLKPDYADAHTNLGNTLKELGRLEDAEASYRQAIVLKPDYVIPYNNLGLILKELGRLNEAETTYKKAIKLKIDFAEAYYNLGVLLHEMNKLKESETSFRQSIALKPDYIDAHNNLGNVLQEQGKILPAINSFKKAIKLKPRDNNAWLNVYNPLQVIKSQNSLMFAEDIKAKSAKISKSILKYRLSRGTQYEDNFLNEAINVFSSVNNTFVKNPKVISSELKKPALPKKITALLHFGRSGTGLLHSLIDGHPEISTLPSIYFTQFFHHSNWEKIIAGGWEEIADRFVEIYEVLFNASSTIPIFMVNNKLIYNIGKKEGMTNVGTKRDEILSVDKKVFLKELKQLMSCYDELDAFIFFKLVHSAYEIAIQNHKNKDHIFYHIHNPDPYARLNFLRLAPNTNWLMMVREPIQNCESWIRINFLNNDYNKVANKIFQMLFGIDQIFSQNQGSIGVKLEDLKDYPKKTVFALCRWLDIKEIDSLYEMTAQGKKWWGDPSSPVYKDDGMYPFGKVSTTRKLGIIFSKNDQFILSTLFYPFNVRFNYVKENLEQFKKDLQMIRPMIDQIFDFEKKIAQNKNIDMKNFMKSGPYIFLRSGMIERWNTLNKFHTYPNMLKLLKID
jgi:tetratricopeptide (TPR) repeat protein